MPSRPSSTGLRSGRRYSSMILAQFRYNGTLPPRCSSEPAPGTAGNIGHGFCFDVNYDVQEFSKGDGPAVARQKKRRPIGVDLFAGAGGLSLGFEQAGFDVAAAVEYDH